MIVKQIILKAHCNSCLELLYKKPVTLKVKHIKFLHLANDILKAIFPKTISCKECENHNVDYSYLYTHVHKFENEVEKNKAIDRCKAQIAETYNTNSDIPAKDRAVIREGFQEQLQALLQTNQISIS